MNYPATDRTRLFIFDADDTLRQTTVPGQPCPHRPGEWELLPGVRERLCRYEWGVGGLHLGIASNQDHVGYGVLDAEMAWRLLADLVSAAFGPVVAHARIELCPHVPEAGCLCRKPRPGMLQAVMAYHRVPPHQTLFVGNADEDRMAAALAGTRFMWAADFFA